MGSSLIASNRELWFATKSLSGSLELRDRLTLPEGSLLGLFCLLMARTIHPFATKQAPLSQHFLA
jgi:hypothetical protein